jgi:adenylate kinase
MRHSQPDKAESVANLKSQIQIVDTHESLKTPVNIGFPA